MKVRSGFVSNSSSSSFLVSVPKGFKVTMNDIVKCDNVDEMYENDDFYDEDNDCLKPEAVDAVNDVLKSIANGNSYSNWDGSAPVFLIHDILDKNDMIIMDLPGAGGDGEDTIVPFKDKRKKKQ